MREFHHIPILPFYYNPPQNIDDGVEMVYPANAKEKNTAGSDPQKTHVMLH